MPAHFYLAPELLDGGPRPGLEITLPEARTHYLVKVLRKRQGDTVACFDGRGQTFQCQVRSTQRRQGALKVLSVAEPAAAPVHTVHMALALLKGQGMDRAIQLCVELGASRITLLKASRCNAQVEPERRDNRFEHWQRIVEGACEQSGRRFLPALAGVLDLDGVLNESRSDEVMICEADGSPLDYPLAPANRTVLIGPEGGWTETELSHCAAAGALRISLGPHVMRAETAPAAALALLHFASGDQPEPDSTSSRTHRST